MHPLVIILPLLMVLGGVALFLFLPLELPMRVFLLISELIAAGGGGGGVGQAVWAVSVRSLGPRRGSQRRHRK
ncbi:MAG: hypothetical protein M5U12_27240 [Verrucomicrobia bacterium]|nr:hypothetical protein [Verrucomicrobiota bacterium]